jgi:hypothetical protein
MKQFLCMGLLAVTALLGTQERASAWVRFKFCAGVNAEFSYHGSDFGWCFWRRCNPPPADCYQGGAGYQHAFGVQPQNFQAYQGYGTNNPAAPATQPSAAPASQPPADPSTALAPGYSNLYQQYYYYYPASYYPADQPHFRVGIDFGR